MQRLEKIGLRLLPLYLGLLLFAASLTPSLIPRGWLAQGALGGIVLALGYLIGRAIMVLWRAMELPLLKGSTAQVVHAIAGAPVIIIVLACLGQTLAWQNGIRERMGMELLDNSHMIRMILVAIGVFVVLAAIGLLVQWVFDRLRFWLYGYMPVRTANVAGLLLTALVVFIVSRDGVLDNAVTALDTSYTVAQDLFDTAPPAPTEAGITGGPGSLIDWAAMGQPGRNFVTSGPAEDEISAFTGRNALKPLRIYAGLAQADTPTERAAVALEELKRQGGFDRKVLIIALPTGTGWLDPGAFDTVEYMHDGNIASIAVQYSYLQSPLALMLQTRAGLDQARALISAVHGHWRSLPEATRPRLYIHGLSLGAWSSMYGTDLFALLDDPIDGALWAGPPFPSSLWNDIVSERKPDSPYVLPELGNGRLVRFYDHRQQDGGAGGWGGMRIAYLQYASDPIVFYEPVSVFRKPRWLNEAPAHDVSPDIRFVPVVTQFQLAIDMALATTAPAGHGHSYYGPDYVRPWAAVTAPENWTDADSTRLAAYCDHGFKMGCQ